MRVYLQNMKTPKIIFLVAVFVTRFSPRGTEGPIVVNATGFNQYQNEFIRRGHSHNDYHQENPLESALRHGMRSIEVDVFPIENELLVGHTKFELEKAQNIDSMYIKPLLQILQDKKPSSTENSKYERISVIPRITSRRRDYKTFVPYKRRKVPEDRKNYGKQDAMILNPHDGSLILLVDFKADPNLSAKLLDKSIAQLKPYLSKVANGKFVKGKVTVLISGNRPKKHCLFSEEQPTSHRKSSLFRGGAAAGADTRNDKQSSWQRYVLQRFTSPKVDENATRYLFLDGRIGDLNTQQDSSLVPLVSFDWKMIQFRQLFRGKGDDVIQKMTDRAHAQGKRMRIWGAPNTEQSWISMLRNNVDLLSVDDHERFARFATTQKRWGNKMQITNF